MSAPCAADHDPAEAQQLFTFEAFESSYRECRRRKRGTAEAGGYRWMLYSDGTSEHAEAMLASYRAILDRADTYKLRRSLGARFPWLRRLFPPTSHKPFWRERRSFPCFVAQAHAFRERFAGSVIAIEVGRFPEVHGWRAGALGGLQGLPRPARGRLPLDAFSRRAPRLVSRTGLAGPHGNHRTRWGRKREARSGPPPKSRGLWGAGGQGIDGLDGAGTGRQKSTRGLRMSPRPLSRFCAGGHQG